LLLVVALEIPSHNHQVPKRPLFDLAIADRHVSRRACAAMGVDWRGVRKLWIGWIKEAIPLRTLGELIYLILKSGPYPSGQGHPVMIKSTRQPSAWKKPHDEDSGNRRRTQHRSARAGLP
jgi:hypothetical protein